MQKTNYCGKLIGYENRQVIEQEINLICDIATRLKTPYNNNDNMTIETAITETLKKLLIKSAKKLQ